MYTNDPNIETLVSDSFENNLYPVPQSTSDTQQIRGAVVAAGTSRAIILSGEQLQGICPEDAMLSIMKGRNTQDLMDIHSQTNEVRLHLNNTQNFLRSASGRKQTFRGETWAK